MKWWWLMIDSMLENNNHPSIHPEDQLVRESDLTSDQLECIHQLYNHGFILSTISGVYPNTTFNFEKMEKAIDDAFTLAVFSTVSGQ